MEPEEEEWIFINKKNLNAYRLQKFMDWIKPRTRIEMPRFFHTYFSPTHKNEHVDDSTALKTKCLLR
jgi:hypothetical protein